jgi:uncharacterized protein (DUF849 family)
MSKRKIIITCAVTGSGAFNPRHPHVPVTPSAIAESAIAAGRAGAAIAHIHVRDPKTAAASRDPALFREVVDRIRQSGSPVLINLTGGMGAILFPDPLDESRALPKSDVVGVEERTEHLADCLPDIASLDCTTGNQVDGGEDFVYLNTTRTLRAMAREYGRLSIKPELEAFHAGDLEFIKQMLIDGEVPPGAPMIQFVLGVLWGAPADPETVLYMRNQLPPGSVWTALGIARREFPIAAQSILLGGHVRVGLEDNLYLDRGVFATNEQLVERAVRLVETMGEAVATSEDARSMLQIPMRQSNG